MLYFPSGIAGLDTFHSDPKDDGLLSNQEVSTSQANGSAIKDEIPVKGREFYDKLLVSYRQL